MLTLIHFFLSDRPYFGTENFFLNPNFKTEFFFWIRPTDSNFLEKYFLCTAIGLTFFESSVYIWIETFHWRTVYYWMLKLNGITHMDSIIHVCKYTSTLLLINFHVTFNHLLDIIGPVQERHSANFGYLMLYMVKFCKFAIKVGPIGPHHCKTERLYSIIIG